MRLVFPAAFAAAMLASLASAPSARAMGAVVSDPPGASSAIAVRIAIAAGDGADAGSGQTARWASVTVQGSATRFAWIVPARPGALLGLTSDAWLESLEAATAPRVVPPDETPPCGFPGGIETDGSFTPTATTAPESSGAAVDRASLDTLLAGWGLSIGPDLSPAIDAVLASGSGLVALLFTGVPGTVVTRTMRVVDDAPAAVPLSLVAAGASPVQVTAYALRAASTTFGTAPELELNPADVLWRDDGTSTYASASDALLGANPGRWLVETTGPYASLAASESQSDAGTSDDLAIAASAIGSGDAWLTRARSLIAPTSFGTDADLASADVAPAGPLVHASGYAQTCEASAPAPSPSTQGSGGGSGGAQGSSQGTSAGAVVDIGAGAAQAADSSDACSGDTSDSSGDDCSGDTSTSTEGSDSGSSDSGCSGSSTDSSGDSGGGCSGSSSSSDSSSSNCSVSRGRTAGRRSGTSRFLVFLVGLAALSRRRKRTPG